MRAAGRLLALAVQWRRWLALALVLTGAAGIAVVTIGPVWNRATLESNLRETLRSEGARTAVRVVATYSPRDFDQRDLDGGTAVLTPDRLPGYLPKVRTLQSTIRAEAVTPGSALPNAPAEYTSSGAPVTTNLVFRSNACQVVRIVQGRCPTADGEVMVSEAVAGIRDYRQRLGATLKSFGSESGDSIVMKVVGVYRVPDPESPYWFGAAFPITNGTGTDSSTPLFDPLLTAEQTVRTVPASYPLFASSDYLLDPASIRLADLPAVQRGIAQLRARFAVQYASQATARVSTRFGEALDEVDRRQATTALGGVLVTLQLALLAWAVLFHIATDAAEARTAEVALLRLRGASRLRTVLFTLAEPLVLLALAVPIGIAGGWGAVALLAPTVLLPGTPVLLDPAAVLAALGAFTGGALAIALAARSVLRRGVLELWSGAARSVRTARPLAVDLVLAAAAVSGGVLLLVLGRSVGVAVLLVPGLLVAAVALLGVRLMPATVRLAVSPTRTARSVPLFLAVRQVARRPAGLRLIAVLAVALGLASFAVVAQGAALTDRRHQAEAEVGAARTFRAVGARPGEVIAAVGAADPDRRWAMAAAEWSPNGGTISGRVLGVEPDRYGAVGYGAAGGAAAAEVGSTTAPPVRPVRFHGTALSARIQAEDVAPAGSPLVAFDLVDSRGRTRQVVAGPLRDGTREYAVQVACRGGCEVIGLTWQRIIVERGAIRGTVHLSRLAADGRALGLPRSSSGWIAAPPVGYATDRVRAGADGVRDAFTSDDGGWGGIRLASRPSPIPVLAAPGAVLSPEVDPVPRLVDTAQHAASIRVAATSPVLPVVFDRGAIVDLATVDGALGTFASEVRTEVWLGDQAPPDALQRLARAGLRLRPLDSVAAAEGRLSRQGTALSLLLLATCAVAAALLAMLATAISIASTARRRSYEAAVMLALGLPRGQVYRAALAEQAVLLVAAVLLAVPAGYAAAQLAMPVLPRFDVPAVIGLIVVPSPVPALVLTAAFVALLLLAAGLGALGVVRGAVGARLREGDE